MMKIMNRIKVGTIAAELPNVPLLSKVLEVLPQAMLPKALQSDDSARKENTTSAASAKANEQTDTVFSGVVAEVEKGESLDDEGILNEAGIFTVVTSFGAFFHGPICKKESRRESPDCQMIILTLTSLIFAG
jgi:hypothetical protein